ncbi:MAG TPA: DUF6701 domain-containing protein, partial [Burkholderiales bacterium]|nr:DUF6701 domain-containing protein [Burkholderiales bacterium]
NVVAPLAITRNPAPDGPYGTLGIGIAPSDPDGVTLLAAALNLDADNDATPERVQVGAATGVRFGRLLMQSVYGPNNRNLPMLIEAQYWGGSNFTQNVEDDCTTFIRSDFALTFFPPPPPPPVLPDLVACETAMVQATLTLADGRATLTMANPGAGNSGTVRLTANLDSAAGNYCPAVGAAGLPATNAARAYLLGRWDGGAAYDDKPGATAAFGLYGSQPKNFIFFRENY